MKTAPPKVPGMPQANSMPVRLFCWAKAHTSFSMNPALTSMVVSDHQTFTPVIHLNTVNSMHSGFKKLYRHYRGVSTKYLSRYLALYIFMRRFMGMDNQEKLMVFLAKTKETLASFTKVMVKSLNLLQV